MQRVTNTLRRRDVEVAKPNYVEPPFWSKTSWIQIGYGVWVSQILIVVGFVVGFSAIIVPQLKKKNSKISTTISNDAVIVSVVLISSVAGNVICGALMDHIGRRAIMIWCLVPVCAGWFTIGLAGNVSGIIAGRIISGVGIGMASGCPRAYCSEISLPNIRSTIGSFPPLALSLGVTIQAVMGAYLHWSTVCYINGSYSIFLTILNYFLPESPHFLLLKGNVADTLKSLKKFRAKDYHEEELELNEMMEFKQKSQLRRLSTREAMRILFSPFACRPFSIIVAYILIGQFSGQSIVTFWTVVIMKQSKLSMSAYHGNIVISIVKVVAGVLVSLVIFKIKRRFLALSSACGVGVVCCTFGAYILLVKQPTIFPMIEFVLYVILASLGYHTLPLLMLFEVTPLQIRGLLSGICMALLNCISFAVNFLFPYLLKSVGLGVTMILFGCMSFAGSIFLYVFLPETHGRSLNSIEESHRQMYSKEQAPAEPISIDKSNI